MKKLIKSIALLAAVASAFASCEAEIKVEEPKETDVNVEFTAAPGITSKTVFGTPSGTTYPVLWTSKDTQIAVSLNYGAPVTATGAAASDSKTATFKATFPITTGDCTFYAISPAAAVNAVEASVIKFTIPAYQTQEDHSVDQAAQILYGTSAKTTGVPEKVSLTFNHVAAYAKLNLTGADFTGLTKVEVTTTDVNLTGTVAYNTKDGSYSVESGSKGVTVAATSASEVWVGVAPCDLSAKTVTVTATTATNTYTKSITLPEGVKLAAGQVTSLDVDMAEAPVKDPTEIKILAIGNSFSVDAMQYLFPILQQLGYKTITLGNLYIGGCSLQTHATNIAGDNAAYTYYTNTANSWSNKASQKVSTALSAGDWDYISVQQASPNSGQADSYDPYLGQIIDAAKAACPAAKIIWHMTWAYQANCNYTGFANYDYDEAKMYSAIVDAVKAKVVTRSDVDLVIPSGTAIANLRTSFILENTSRDGYHLNYGVGRLTAAYMWAKAITGGDITAVDYTPASYPVSERELAAIKEAVNAAYAKPYEVTKATDTNPISGYTSNTVFIEQLTAAGYNMANYDELPYAVYENSYYNSSNSGILQHKNNGITATNLNQFAATPYYFTKDDLPAGTLLVVHPEYMYRPEGWTNLYAKTSARPANTTGTTSPVTKVDAAWWGDFKYRAFNIAKIGNPALTEAEQAAIRSKFAIFVPKPGTVISDPTCDEIVEQAGKNVSDYVKLPLGYVHNAYYYSGDANVPSKLLKLSDGYTTGKTFSATKILPKASLPNGTLLVIRGGYMYRPEAWTALNAKTASRPGEVSTSLVEVDDTWWGSYNYRAFNIRTTDKKEITAEMQPAIEAAFCVYVPKTYLAGLTTTDAVLEAYGYDVSAYEKESPTLTAKAYYNSSNKNAPGPDGLFTTASNSAQFAATKIYAKSELPNGTILVQLNGYQYRPDGWVDLKTANASSARPGNVLDQVLVVTDAWWGSFNYRGFNLAKKGNPTLTDAEQESLKTAFAIYRKK